MIVLAALLFAPAFAQAQGFIIQAGPTYGYNGYPNYPYQYYPYPYYSYPYYPYSSWYGYPNGFFGGPALSFGFTFGHGYNRDYGRRFHGGSHFQHGPYYGHGYRGHGGGGRHH